MQTCVFCLSHAGWREHVFCLNLIKHSEPPWRAFEWLRKERRGLRRSIKTAEQSLVRAFYREVPNILQATYFLYYSDQCQDDVRGWKVTLPVYSNAKFKFWVCLIKHHAIEICQEMEMSLNLNNGWKWLVSVKLRPFYHTGKVLSINRRWVDVTAGLGQCKGNNVRRWRESNPGLSSASQSLYLLSYTCFARCAREQTNLKYY
jgi:hypothetical protein